MASVFAVPAHAKQDFGSTTPGKCFFHAHWQNADQSVVHSAVYSLTGHDASSYVYDVFDESGNYLRNETIVPFCYKCQPSTELQKQYAGLWPLHRSSIKEITSFVPGDQAHPDTLNLVQVPGSGSVALAISYSELPMVFDTLTTKGDPVHVTIYPYVTDSSFSSHDKNVKDVHIVSVYSVQKLSDTQDGFEDELTEWNSEYGFPAHTILVWSNDLQRIVSQSWVDQVMCEDKTLPTGYRLMDLRRDKNQNDMSDTFSRYF